MHILAFPDHVLEDICGGLDQRSLVCLQNTCRFLNRFCSTYLLRRIYIVDRDTRIAPRTSKESAYSLSRDYTFISAQNLDNLTNFLAANPESISIINEVVLQAEPFNPNYKNFLKLCSSFPQQNRAITSIKFDDMPNLYGRNIFFSSSNQESGNSPLYENDETIDDDSSISSSPDFPDLENKFHLNLLQIFSPNDLTLLANKKLKIKQLEIALNSDYSPSCLSDVALEKISSLVTSFKVLNDKAGDCFRELMIKYDRNHSHAGMYPDPPLFSKLTTFTYCMRDIHFMAMTGLMFGVDMQNLHSLEFKFKRSAQLFGYDFGVIGDHINESCNPQLKSLSLINLNNHNMLANNIFQREVFGYSDPCPCWLSYLDLFMKKNIYLQNLVICFNTFITVVEPVFSGTDSSTQFVVTQNYLDLKQSVFDGWVNSGNLVNLKRLTLPDFLFNWVPFLSFSAHINKEFNKTVSPINSQSAATAVIRELYSRFPSFDNASFLEIHKQPARKSVRTLCSKEMLTKYFDLLVPILAHFCNQFPKLVYLNLGGFAVEINRNSDGIHFEGIYDDWKCHI